MSTTLFDSLVSALAGTGIPFALEAWDSRPAGTYGVLHREGAGAALWADGHMQLQAPEGSVDLFTDSADRAAMQAVQAALNAVDGLAWRLESVQYESDTRLLHWEWVYQLERE